MSFVSKEFAAAIPESTNLVAFRNMEPKPLTFLAHCVTGAVSTHDVMYTGFYF